MSSHSRYAVSRARSIFRIGSGFAFLILGQLLAGPTGSLRAAPATAPFDIPKLDGIIIDGDLADWQDRGFRINAVNWQPLPADADNYDPSFQVAWTDAGLLAAATILDDQLVSPENFIYFIGVYQGDSFAVSVSSGSEKTWLTRTVVGLGDAPNHVEAKSASVYPGEISETPASAARRAVQLTDGGYTFEVLIPWQALEITPVMGDEIGLTLQAFDQDPAPEGAPEPLRVVTNWDAAPVPGLGLRLATSASPSLSVAAGSPFHTLSASVAALTGAADQAGKAFQIRWGDEVVASGVLELLGDRAVAHRVIPKAVSTDEINRELVALVDGERVSRFGVFPAAEQNAALIVTAQPPADAIPGDLAIRVGLQLGETQFAYPSATADVVVKNPAGATVAKTRIPLAEDAVVVSVPDGLYTVNATIRELEGWRFEGRALAAVGDAFRLVQQTLSAADAMAAEPQHSDYAGWLNYLATDIRQYLSAPETEESLANVTARTVELAEWIAKIERNPDALEEQRGRFEWAYLSKVDGTGQPFTIELPADYAADKAWALDVSMHGASGSHLTIGGPQPVPGITLSVLGRNPVGGYRGLAEVDVLEAIAYVREHWKIDPNRIHLTGGSMGGGGTFLIASRFPDLFASARPFCGYALDAPIENLLHVPLCSVHSQDDWIVPISTSRGPVRLLQDYGGAAIQHETNKIGHNVNEWYEGAAFAHGWAGRQVRPSAVNRVHYEATDQLARKAYWTEVVEWGPQSRPATVDARIEEGNFLYLALDNVGIARFDLAMAPVDARTTLTVVIDATVVGTVPPSLPAELYISRTDTGWLLGAEEPEAPSVRRHFPGGAMALYHGEPLMVVWGTQGEDEVTSRILNVARSARKSSSPQWPVLRPHKKIGFIFNEITSTYFGELPGKPDVEVTPEDMQRYNLLLIGTAQQNSVVAGLADRLPVRIEGDRVRSSDGVEWSFQNRALGLLYHNPQEPQRLIYWACSNDPAFYQPECFLMGRQGWDMASPDLMLTHASLPWMGVARNFDSRWQWEAGYDVSPAIPGELQSPLQATEAAASCLLSETGSNFALIVSDDIPATDTTIRMQDIRAMDLWNSAYGQRVATFKMSGRELLAAADRLPEVEAERKARRARGERADPVPQLLPTPKREQIDLDRDYQVALIPWAVWDFSSALQINPCEFRLTEHTMRDALRQHLPD